jgi:hypothetical protein
LGQAVSDFWCGFVLVLAIELLLAFAAGMGWLLSKGEEEP